MTSGDLDVLANRLHLPGDFYTPILFFYAFFFTIRSPSGTDRRTDGRARRLMLPKGRSRTILTDSRSTFYSISKFHENLSTNFRTIQHHIKQQTKQTAGQKLSCLAELKITIIIMYTDTTTTRHHYSVVRSNAKSYEVQQCH